VVKEGGGGRSGDGRERKEMGGRSKGTYITTVGQGNVKRVLDPVRDGRAVMG